MAKYINSVVEIECSDSSVYRGVLVKVDEEKQILYLKNSEKDGALCDKELLPFNVSTMKRISIVAKLGDEEKPAQNIKPISFNSDNTYNKIHNNNNNYNSNKYKNKINSSGSKNNRINKGDNNDKHYHHMCFGNGRINESYENNSRSYLLNNSTNDYSPVVNSSDQLALEHRNNDVCTQYNSMQNHFEQPLLVNSDPGNVMNANVIDNSQPIFPLSNLQGMNSRYNNVHKIGNYNQTSKMQFYTCSSSSRLNERQTQTIVMQSEYEHSGNTKHSSCFDMPVERITETDFDFEKNLALFDKKQFSDSLRDVPQNKKKGNFDVHENVLETNPVKYRQVTVPKPDTIEYVTDDGLIIPSITGDLKWKLLMAAETEGLTSERQSEIMGRAACEMILQLLGGNYRLNPKNAHQLPVVVVLSGMHKRGALGLNCARQLESYGVHTYVFLAQSKDFPIQVAHEISIYKQTKGQLVSDVKGLPNALSVDFIIMCLADDNDTQININVLKWLQKNKAPLMSIDPPRSGTPSVTVRYSLISALPLSYEVQNGKLYLCNLAIPISVYEKVGISYQSPFGSKSVIPLHEKSYLVVLHNEKLNSVTVRYSLISAHALLYTVQDWKLYHYKLAVPISVFETVCILYQSPFGSKSVIPLHEKSHDSFYPPFQILSKLYSHPHFFTS